VDDARQQPRRLVSVDPIIVANAAIVITMLATRGADRSRTP
jgi:hypothetical protein